MPKETFFNIAEEKRQRIIDVAINEFATHSYPKSSINRIVKESGIAKGSFYQYFANKKDLFKYIIELGGRKKLEYLDKVMKRLDELSFFEILRGLYSAGIQFGQDYYKLQFIGARFLKSEDEELKREILGKNYDLSDKILNKLLASGVKKGEIDPKVDIELISFMLTRFSLSLTEYFLDQNIEIKENGEVVNLTEDTDKLMELVDQLINIIKHGIKKS